MAEAPAGTPLSSRTETGWKEHGGVERDEVKARSLMGIIRRFVSSREFS